METRNSSTDLQHLDGRSGTLDRSWFLFACGLAVMWMTACSKPMAETTAVDASPDGEACSAPCGESCCAADQQCDATAGACVAPGCGTGPACGVGSTCDTGAGTCVEEIRVATYNILGSHFLQDPSPICLDRSGAACTELRASNFMRIVRGYAGFGAFDVVGVQEMERDQYIQIGTGLSGADPAYTSEPLKYDRHPIAIDPNYLIQNIDDFARTIYWRHDKFDVISKGRLVYPTNDGTNIGVSRDSYAPWVKLRSKATGRAFVVLNHHAAVTTGNIYRSPESAVFREQTAHIVSTWAAQVHAQQHVPVVIMGDFNSTFQLRSVAPHDDDIIYAGDRSRLPYCVMTAGGVLRNASDTVDGKSGACPTLIGGAVDHLYPTIGMPVVDLVRVPKHPPTTSPATDLVSHCSDHGPVYADLGL